MRHLRASNRDRERITALLQAMTYDSWIYRAIKKELQFRGNWKDSARGKPDIRNLSGKQSASKSGLSYDI